MIKIITKKKLIKAKEKFLNIYKENECIPISEYNAFINMLKFIDFLIDEVK